MTGVTRVTGVTGATGVTGRTQYTLVPCPFGELLVATDDGVSLTKVWLPPAEPRAGWICRDDLPVLVEARQQLAGYFAGDRTAFDLPLAPTGTPFQRRVWDALRTIEYGTTRSYGQIAADIGAPGSARAVGSANHDNPIAIVVPCHRVVGARGALIGFAGGIEQKRALLELESGDARLPL